ncbi:unnamed protein product, partial [marine sediment metagenome]
YDGLSAGTGDISVDPKLADVAYDNMHIQPDSPCRDAGDDGVVEPDWVDMDGQARDDGGGVDIGADESYGEWWPGGPNVVVRVSPSGNDSNDGSSWALAKRTVQAGIYAASAQGGEVWVAAGTYYERITLQPYAYVYGGFAGTESLRQQRDWNTNTTTIDGGNGGSVVVAQGGYRTTISGIDGFTITNGTGTLYVDNYYGGGIYCYYSSPSISNNTITGNSVDHPGSTGDDRGGGIYCYESSPNISNNT